MNPKKLKGQALYKYMLQARNDGLSDAEIGRKVGRSRARVGQILGPKDRATMRIVRRLEEMRPSETMTSVANELGIPVGRVWRAAKYTPKAIKRHKEARKAFLKSENYARCKAGIQQFLNEVGRGCLTATLLRRWSKQKGNSIYNAAMAIQSIAAWREEFGLEDETDFYKRYK